MPKDKGGDPTKIKVTARRRKDVTLSGVRYDEIPANMDRGKPAMKGFKQVQIPQYRVPGTNSFSWEQPPKRAVHKR